MATQKLYWCSTPDHDEDWFVVARSARTACRYHEREEGYVEGDAEAELVCALPAGVTYDGVGWPSEELVAACGGEIARTSGGRIVRIAGRIYGEGNVGENAAAKLRLVRRQWWWLTGFVRGAQRRRRRRAAAARFGATSVGERFPANYFIACRRFLRRRTALQPHSGRLQQTSSFSTH